MRIDVRKWGLTALGFLVFASCNNSPVSSTTISTSSRETDATSADEALLQKIGVPGLLTFEKGFIHVPKDDDGNGRLLALTGRLAPIHAAAWSKNPTLEADNEKAMTDAQYPQAAIDTFKQYFGLTHQGLSQTIANSDLNRCFPRMME